MIILYYRFVIVSNNCHLPRHRKQRSLLAVKAAAKHKGKRGREHSRPLLFVHYLYPPGMHAACRVLYISPLLDCRYCKWQNYAQNISVNNVAVNKASGWENVPTVAPGIPSKKSLMFRRVPLVARA